jgi:ABC-2 type transport system permease protein
MAGSGEPAPVGARAPAGVIYDIGYQRYDGPRLGRGAVVTALYGSSLRSAFGIGRGGRAKIVPFGLFTLAVLPALIAVGAAALLNEAVELFSYDDYLWSLGLVFALFAAAQAPELVGRDQKHRVLTLYFSRALERADYVAAKLAAMVTALAILTGVPLLILLVGTALGAEDVLSSLGEELRELPGIVGNALLHAILFAVLGLAVAAHTPRRAYATGGIIALFLILGAVEGIVGELAEEGLWRYVVLLNPFTLVDGVRQWAFGGAVPDSAVDFDAVPGVAHLLAYVVVVAGLGALVAWRYRRLET